MTYPRKTNSFREEERRKISTKKVARTLLDLKSDKKFVTILPSLLCSRDNSKSTIERESLEYRLDYLRKNNPAQFNSLLFQILSKIDQFKIAQAEVAEALGTMKQSAITFFEETKQ